MLNPPSRNCRRLRDHAQRFLADRVRFARSIGLAGAAVLVLIGGRPLASVAAEPPARTINAVVEDPSNTVIAYAATSEGLFKTSDDGESWQPLAIPGAGTEISAVAVSPVDSQRLLAGSGLGLFLSTNGGAAWTKLKNPKSEVTVIAIASGTGQSIAVGTESRGLYVSSDGGMTFKPRKSRLPRPVGRGARTSITGAAASPSDPDSGWVGTEVDGIYRRERTKFFPPDHLVFNVHWRVGRIWIAADPLSVNTIYGVVPTRINSGRSENRLYRSQDGGHTWPSVTVIDSDATFTALYFRPGDSSTLYLRDRASLVSIDLGNVDWLNAPLADPLSPDAGGPRGGTAPTVFERGQVTVVVDDGSIMRAGRVTDDQGNERLQCENNAANDDITWDALARAVYGPANQRRLTPAHEHLVVWPARAWIGRNDPECNMPIVNTAGGAGAYQQPLRTARGTGHSVGSPDANIYPSPLLGLLNMNDALDRFSACNDIAALYVLAHETAHTWVAYPRYRSSSGVSSELFDSGSHWSLGTNSEGSHDGGYEWRDDGNGDFTAIGNGYRFGGIDQYMMGLRAPEEVTNLFLLHFPPDQANTPRLTGVGILGGISGAGASPVCSPFNPDSLTTLHDATREPIDVDQIVDVEGRRSGPDGRHLHSTFVLLLPPGSVVNEPELALLEQRRQEWSQFYHRASEGRGVMETCLRPPCNSCGDGARADAEQCDGGDLGGSTCASFSLGGTLGCKQDCRFDLSHCTSTCGNGQREGSEACDGQDLGGSTCLNNGFSGGQLHCTSACSFDFTGCANGTGRIQGDKVQVNGLPLNDPVIRLDGGSPTTDNPFSYTQLAPGNHRVTSSEPAGFQVAFSTCVNCTNHPANSFTAGNSALVNVPSTGFVDVRWRYSPQVGTIQGIKIDANNQGFTGGSVTVDGAGATTSNPFSFSGVAVGSHQVAVTVPSGFAASHAVCVNCTNQPSSTFTSGSSVIVNVPSGGFVDVWWKFTATNPGLVQGVKIDANNQGFSGGTVTIDSAQGTTANPFSFGNLAAGSHVVATTVPSGFTASRAVCVNCLNTPSSTFTAGSSVTVNVPAGGYVDVWWKFTSTNPGLVQGIKIDANNQGFSGGTVTIDGAQGTTANPFSFGNLAPGSHIVATTVPSGFTVSRAVCVNCLNSPSSTFTAGSSVNVSVPAGGYVDVWWKFTPTNPGLVQGIKIDANNQGFSGGTVTIDGAQSTTANPYSYSNLAPGSHVVATTIPSGFTVSRAVCVNCLNSPSSTFTAGNSATVNVPAGGFVDVWWKYTPTNPGLVQGIKIDGSNHAFDSPTIRIDGAQSTTANPYSYGNLAPGSHTVSTTVPSGFTASHAVCVNCLNQTSSTFTAGSSVAVNVPAGGFVDVWWKYTP